MLYIQTYLWAYRFLEKKRKEKTRIHHYIDCNLKHLTLKGVATLSVAVEDCKLSGCGIW